MLPELSVAPWMLYVSVAVAAPMLLLGYLVLLIDLAAGNFWSALAGFAWFIGWGVVLGAALERLTP
jgi:hypothetical protein